MKKPQNRTQKENMRLHSTGSFPVSTPTTGTALEQFADLIAGRISEFHEVYPIHWYNDHEYEWLETQSSIPKYEINGDLRQLIGSARVITAQKQMEESLRIAKEEAERSNTLKSAFLANMTMRYARR